MADLDFIGRTTQLGGLTGGHTFAAVDIGVADAGRKVVVSWAGVQQGADAVTPTVSIDGNLMDEDGPPSATVTDGNGNRAWCGIFSLDVPAGTAADIAVAFVGATFFDATIWVHTVTDSGGLQDTASDSNGAGASPHTLDLDVDLEDEGALIACGIAFSSSGNIPAFAWNGATEDDEQVEYSSVTRGAASHAGAATETPRDVSVTITSTAAIAYSIGQAVTYSASGASTVTGSGDLVAQSATAAGTGERIIDGDGAASSGSSTAAGSGERVITGSGALAAGSATTTGGSGQIVTGSGACQAGRATVSGIGGPVTDFSLRVAVQRTVFGMLNGAVFYKGVAVAVYDNVPQKTPTPYITVGEDHLEPDDTDDSQGAEGTLEVTVWSGKEYAGRLAAKFIADQIHVLLHRTKPNVSGYTLAALFWDSSDNFDEVDGATRRLVETYRVLLQE